MALMNDPCQACPYELSPVQKENLCSNPDNNLCKHFLIFQGYLIGKKEVDNEK